MSLAIASPHFSGSKWQENVEKRGRGGKERKGKMQGGSAKINISNQVKRYSTSSRISEILLRKRKRKRKIPNP